MSQKSPFYGKREEMHWNECQWQFRCKYPNFIRTRNLLCAPREVGAQFSCTLVDIFSFIKQICWPLFCRIARVAIVRFLGLNRTNSKMNQSNSPFGTEAISNWKRKINMWRMNWRWNLGGTQQQQWQIWMHRSQKWRAGHHQQCIETVFYRLFCTNIALASTSLGWLYLEDIPHICHMHHRWCLCKKKLPGVNFLQI